MKDVLELLISCIDETRSIARTGDFYGLAKLKETLVMRLEKMEAEANKIISFEEHLKKFEDKPKGFLSSVKMRVACPTCQHPIMRSTVGMSMGGGPSLCDAWCSVSTCDWRGKVPA